MNVAAYQAPLLPAGKMPPLHQLREQLTACADMGVELLCCPEGMLGGLADNVADPASIALTQSELAALITPIARKDVTLVIGFTERCDDGELLLR